MVCFSTRVRCYNEDDENKNKVIYNIVYGPFLVLPLIAPFWEDKVFSLSISDIYRAINYIFPIFITESQDWLLMCLKLPFIYHLLKVNMY